jgi:hypothetical protein
MALGVTGSSGELAQPGLDQRAPFRWKGEGPKRRPRL